MKKVVRCSLLLAVSILPLCAETASPQSADRGPTIKVTTRAVVEDVIVTDRHGKPVKGLKQSDFTVTEQGKPQTITFFEEHHAGPIAPVAAPKLPPDVFSNFSPYPLPPAVNVVLLDSLNTGMASQSWVHDQAVKFLKKTKPGTQTAIFAMGLGFHFIQGFTSDPSALMAALKNKKNNSVEQSPLLIGQTESNADTNLIGMMSGSVPGGGPGTAASPEAASALANFIAENQTSQGFDRFFLTLENLQRLATFLNSFPGRKNVIWFSESVPAIFMIAPGKAGPQVNPSMEAELQRTMNMLAAARVALYPVDAQGLAGNALYEAQTVLPTASDASQLVGPPGSAAYGGTPGGAFSNSLSTEDENRNANQAAMTMLAEQTGGQAFFNTNGLEQVMDKIGKSTTDFYTLSYTPTDQRMDGALRTIDINLPGKDYKLIYRRGYYALDQGIPGAALQARQRGLQAYKQQQGGNVDPLLPFMDLGMPMSNQLLYEAKITPLPPSPSGPDAGKLRYSIDFAVDLKDLDLKLEPDGTHRGVVNFTLLVYDHYGKIISNQERVASLVLKPDVYAAFQNTGLQLHDEIATPKGNYWLRTGIYDQNSRKVGTLEVPLAAVKPIEASSQIAHP
ncbi:MAG: VWA domain-containing protein [Acidobacteriota bacterium]